MRKVGDMKLYNFEELLEDDFGPVGIPERNKFEREVDEAISKARREFHEGKAISLMTHDDVDKYFESM